VHVARPDKLILLERIGIADEPGKIPDLRQQSAVRVAIFDNFDRRRTRALSVY
jgi:hypothetical protein